MDLMKTDAAQYRAANNGNGEDSQADGSTQMTPSFLTKEPQEPSLASTDITQTVIKGVDKGDTLKTLLILTLVCALFMGIELTGGIFANSVAIISDALHLGIDLIGYLVQILALLLTRRSIFSAYL